MGQCGSIVADAASVGLNYAQRLMQGIPDDRFARLAAPGGELVIANHPAFILGHLCLYPVKVVELLGQDIESVKPPANFEAVFSKNATCTDDPLGKLYPDRQQIVEFFAASYATAIQALREARDEQLFAENPVDTPMKQTCPTLGAMLAFYVTGHVAIHLGQLSTWRRMEGLPPA